MFSLQQSSQDANSVLETHAPQTTKLHAGSVIADRTLVSIWGEAIRIPQPGRLVHLQFRRFAGCPVCNLHLQSFVQRHDEIVSADIREVVVFHSTVNALLQYESDLPFTVIADPNKRLYSAFGVETSPRALFDPRAWMPIGRAVLYSLGELIHGRRPAPPMRPEGGSLGLPADFLIAPDGRVCAFKYGRHAADQWSVDEILGLALSQRKGSQGQVRQSVSHKVVASRERERV